MVAGYKISGCPGPCGNYKESLKTRSHYHCPFCVRTFLSKDHLKSHVTTCGKNAASENSTCHNTTEEECVTPDLPKNDADYLDTREPEYMRNSSSANGQCLIPQYTEISGGLITESLKLASPTHMQYLSTETNSNQTRNVSIPSQDKLEAGQGAKCDIIAQGEEVPHFLEETTSTMSTNDRTTFFTSTKSQESVHLLRPNFKECRFCKIRFHPNSLKRHIHLKHQQENKVPVINQENHHHAVCVDANHAAYIWLLETRMDQDILSM